MGDGMQSHSSKQLFDEVAGSKVASQKGRLGARTIPSVQSSRMAHLTKGSVDASRSRHLSYTQISLPLGDARLASSMDDGGHGFGCRVKPAHRDARGGMITTVTEILKAGVDIDTNLVGTRPF